MTASPSRRAWFTKGGRFARRTGWGLADQAFSSLTNFALGMMIARSVTIEEFGAFSLAFATYTLLLGFARSVTTEPLVVRFSHVAPETWRAATASVTGVALLIGLVGGVVCLLAGVVMRGALADAFIALGITLPGLLLQDTWRYAFFARGSGGHAFANDLAWAVVMFPVIVVLVASGHTSITWLTLGWGGAGTVAGAIGILQASVRPRPGHAVRWLRTQADLAVPYAGEFGAMSGARQLSFYAVGVIAGVVAVGAIRGAQILLGPVQVLHNGVRLVAIPEAVRAARTSVRRMRATCTALSAGLSVVALLCGAAVFLLPARIGIELLGPTWDSAHAVAIPMALMLAGGGISTGAIIGLRAIAASDRSLNARLLVSTLQVAGTIGGALMGGAVPAAWGLALGVWAGIPVWHWQLRRAVIEHERLRVAATSPAPAVPADRDHSAPWPSPRPLDSSLDAPARQTT